MIMTTTHSLQRPKDPHPVEFSQIEQTFHSLLRTYGRLRQVMEPHFSSFGTSASQWGILRVLQRAEAAGERGLRLTDLGQRLLIQPPSVTVVVDRMERRGLLERQQSRTDQRSRVVALTPAGRKLLATVLKVHTKKVNSLFAEHDPDEVKVLAGLLQKLENRLRVLADNGRGQGVKSNRKQNHSV
jgi:DNA-binding MarR family transcriptional regulator